MHTKLVLFKVYLLISLTNCAVYMECENSSVGTFVASLQNCQQYIYCNGDESLIGDCPLDNYFNAAASLCEENDGVLCKAVADSEGTLTTTTSTNLKSTTTSTLNTDELSLEGIGSTLENTSATPSVAASPAAFIIGEELTELLRPINAVGRPPCQPLVEQVFSHPQRCEYYYKCTHGFLTILRCNFDYGWDHERQQCVPFDEAKCLNDTL